ncbi:DUF6684 family protein [Halogranum rubrum]|uniref:Cox cluster protein n=1 Tax=Halogranum salarium B-1 TaxID=1210908 RepID=J3A4P6_9EURY|nr:DUF6684 family protein [Halogranum salarium]EJN60443.1 hypothetical protein HSB1_10460 [Halogranum salarium B-1]
MAAKIFDKETMLDLTVNIIPLGIMAFFVVVFAVWDPFGYDPLASAISFGLLLVPLVALAVLTYLSGKAIAGDEKRAEVFLAGQATVPGSQTLEEYEEQAEPDHEPAELTDDESAEDAETEPTAQNTDD